MATIESTTATGLLFNPRTYDAAGFDEPTRRALNATIEWFESRGKRKLKDDDHERVWYADFLEFVKEQRIFATFLTPAADGQGDPQKRWDTARICAFNEITGFYGLPYWYTCRSRSSVSARSGRATTPPRADAPPTCSRRARYSPSA